MIVRTRFGRRSHNIFSCRRIVSSEIADILLHRLSIRLIAHLATHICVLDRSILYRLILLLSTVNLRERRSRLLCVGDWEVTGHGLDRSFHHLVRILKHHRLSLLLIVVLGRWERGRLKLMLHLLLLLLLLLLRLRLLINPIVIET